MTKFNQTSSKRNTTVRTKLANVQPRENLVEALSVPQPDTVNIQGHEAYSLDKFLRLLSMLNTLKLDTQFYRSTSDSMSDVKKVVEECATDNLYLTAQCIVYSRHLGEGMRSVSHWAGACLAQFVSGQGWGARFFGPFNNKTLSGGLLRRPDDMSEILGAYALAKNPESSAKITNAMKKGFRTYIENSDSYQLLKYKKAIIDISNLVHPSAKNSKGKVTFGEDNTVISALEAIMTNKPVSADTWEASQSEAGQIVAKAVKEGKITKDEAVKELEVAKSENWDGLLSDGKLGILAAIRNLRSILKVDVKPETIDKLCDLLSNSEIIKKGLIMPYQLDLAHTIVTSEFNSANSRKIAKALLVGYENAVPNLASLLTGNNLVILDCSGSMGTGCVQNNKVLYGVTCMSKASLIAATIAKATNADVIQFGGSARYKSYSPNLDVFSLSKNLIENMGSTNLAAAWTLASQSGVKYDRVFILSDNECNVGSTYTEYKKYMTNVGSPYVYSIDLASYGTQPLAGDKVRYYYGYGYSMFEDVAAVEFNANYHLDKVKKIII